MPMQQQEQLPALLAAPSRLCASLPLQGRHWLQLLEAQPSQQQEACPSPGPLQPLQMQQQPLQQQQQQQQQPPEAAAALL
jgi:hypothetical protein